MRPLPLEPEPRIAVGADDGGRVERGEACEHACAEVEEDRVEIAADGDGRSASAPNSADTITVSVTLIPMFTRQMNRIGAARRRSDRPSSSSGRAVAGSAGRFCEIGAGDGHGGAPRGRE